MEAACRTHHSGIIFLCLDSVFLYNEEKEVLSMKRIEKKSDTLLLVLCLLSFAVYAVIFASAFAELPLNISPWHQLLLLYFPFIPMFFLELLLCRTATLRWRLTLPLIPLLLVGIWFLTLAEFHLPAWILFLFWCTPSLLGCLAAFGIWAIGKRFRR